MWHQFSMSGIPLPSFSLFASPRLGDLALNNPRGIGWEEGRRIKIKSRSKNLTEFFACSRNICFLTPLTS